MSRRRITNPAAGKFNSLIASQANLAYFREPVNCHENNCIDYHPRPDDAVCRAKHDMIPVETLHG
jgi:hypothetical protein